MRGSEEAQGQGRESERPDEPSEDDGSEEERAPISVRDLMPSPSTRPRRRSTERPSRPQPAEADEEATEDDAPPARPTPVRVAMDAPPPGDSRPAETLPSRRFEVGEEEWVVRVSGRTITGTRPDAGALLMQLTFYRSEAPETPVRELLTVERPLEALYEEDLEEFLERSRAAKQPEEGDAGS